MLENQQFGIPTRLDTNRAVQSQKTARNLKFWMKEKEGFYYPCSENKGADQLRGYREAGLRLCFRLCKLLVFPCGGSNIIGLSLNFPHKKAISLVYFFY